MALFYSDTMSDNQLTEVYDTQFKGDQSKRGSRIRIASGHWTNGPDVNLAPGAQFISLFTVRDTARIWDMFAYGGNEETSITVNIGVAQWSSQTGIGTLIDGDEFASLLTIGSDAANATSVFDEASSAAPTGRRRGQTLAELTGVACEGNEWVVYAQTNSAIDIANYNIGAYCYYTAGD